MINAPTPRETADESLNDLLARAVEHVKAMTPEEREAMHEQQKKAWVAAEMAIGDEGTRIVTGPRETADHVPDAGKKVVQTPMHRDAAKATLALKVARIVDPLAFDHPTVHPQHLKAQRSKALIKADDILASLSTSADHIGEANEKVTADPAELLERAEKWVAEMGEFDDLNPERAEAYIHGSFLLSEIAALRGERDEALDAARKLSVAMSWVDPMLIDNNTNREELISRLGFMHKDAEQPRALLARKDASGE